MYFLLGSLIISTVISLFSSYLVRDFFISKGWVENPVEKQKKTHNATAAIPAPRGGGIPIFLATTISIILLAPASSRLFAIILASLVALFVGVKDDLKDVDPRKRLIVNLLVALIVVGSGIGISFISNPLGPGVIDLSHPQLIFNFFGQPHRLWIFSDILAVLWIMWCMNSVGWSAGISGQLPGFVAISAFFIGLLSLRFSIDSQILVLALAGAVSGAYLGFLPVNFFPQTMQAGYSGKSLAGFYIAVLSILSGAKIATVVYLLAIPMIDATIVVIRRTLQGRSPLQGGPEHFHHLLLKRGWTQKQVTLLYWTVSLLLGGISLLLTSQQKFYTFVGIAIVISTVIIVVYERNSRKPIPTQSR